MGWEVFDIVYRGKWWRIASIHGRYPHRWAWLVNINKPDEQIRLSVNSEAFDHRSSLRQERIAA